MESLLPVWATMCAHLRPQVKALMLTSTPPQAPPSTSFGRHEQPAATNRHLLMHADIAFCQAWLESSLPCMSHSEATKASPLCGMSLRLLTMTTILRFCVCDFGKEAVHARARRMPATLPSPEKSSTRASTRFRTQRGLGLTGSWRMPPLASTM